MRDRGEVIMVPSVLFTVMVMVVLPSSVYAAVKGTQGREFILGFMENLPYTGHPSDNMDLVVTTEATVTVTVEVTAPKFDPSWKKTVTLTRGVIRKVKVPVKFRGKRTEKSTKGLLLQATEPVSVYAVNLEIYSTDAYVALPVNVLGWDYYAVTYIRDAELMVVGVEDGTRVSITWPRAGAPVKVKYQGVTYGNGDTLNLTLNRLETFHTVQYDLKADFTGAHIKSNKPVAALSGNRKVPIPTGGRSSDHLTEMLIPVDMWGKAFISTSTPDRKIGDLYRFVASKDSTTVSFSQGPKFLLKKAGDFVELNMATGDYRKFVSTQPIQVAVFSKTFQNDGPLYGDPAMCLLIPEDQYASRYTWATVTDPQGQQFHNKITVIVAKGQVSKLRLDGKAVSSWNEQKDVVGSDKVHLWKRISPGSHSLSHLDPTVTFMALASGTIRYNSYAYQAGMRMAPINPTAVDGQWSDWGPYGSCSVTCGTGTKSRTRKCDSPAPQYGGKDCPGSDTETAACEKPPCTVNGKWSDWGPYGPCSVTCGTGTKSRSRKCDSPAPQHGGSDCSGPATDSAPCQGVSCPVNGKWSDWGPYGPCSVTCGTGTKSRSRKCDSPAPQHGGKNCPGPATDSASCQMVPCSVDGQWGDWGPFTSCSVTCGTGTQSRSRKCDNPAPQHGGSDCSGSATHTVHCQIVPCPVDGQWSDWGPYGPCSVTCGTGTKSRSRQCDNPAPQHGGNSCSGSASDTLHCTKSPCPVNGKWSDWGPYGPCSVTCGTGTKSRSRKCDSPAPQHGGNRCSGSATYTVHCRKRPCPINGQWGSWERYGPCSVTCGTGLMSRTRECDSPAPQFGGAACPGAPTHTAPCFSRNCSSCSGNAKADIVFILDASGSVGSSNFKVMKRFVRDLVDAFDIHPNKIRVAVQTYSSTTRAEFHLDQYGKEKDLKQAIMRIQFSSGSSNIGGALDYMQSTMFSSANGDRAGVPNIAMMFTDGHMNNPSVALEKASKAHQAGTEVYVIAVGPKLTGAEFRGLATDIQHVFQVPKFSGLRHLEERFHIMACAPKMFAYTSTSIGDVLFILDASNSVGSTNFQLMKQYVRDMVDGFDIHPNKIRVAVQTYATNTRAEFHLNQYQDKEALKKSIMEIEFTGGSSNIGGALDYMQSTMFTPANGDRPRVPNLVMIFTDGHMNDPSAAVAMAMKARLAGTELFVTAIGPSMAAEDFTGVATDYHHVATVPRFSDLHTLDKHFYAFAFDPTLFVPVGWSQWGAWSTCSRTCGGGHRSRSRPCNDLHPEAGSSSCSGNSVEKIFCANAPCSGQPHCPTEWVSCASGNVTCIHYLRECDYQPDCDDASDENPRHAKCRVHALMCPSSAGTLLPTTFFITSIMTLMAAILPTWVTCCDEGQ